MNIDLKMGLLFFYSLVSLMLGIKIIVKYRKTIGFMRVLLAGVVGNMVYSVLSNLMINTLFDMGILSNGVIRIILWSFVAFFSLFISYNLLGRLLHTDLPFKKARLFEALSYSLSGILMSVFTFLNYAMFILNYKMDSLETLVSSTYTLDQVKSDLDIVLSMDIMGYTYIFMSVTIIPIVLFFTFFSGAKWIKTSNKRQGYLNFACALLIFISMYTCEVLVLPSVIKVIIMLVVIGIVIAYQSYIYKKMSENHVDA